ncbi:MAG TPA: hypothetical protein VL137_00700 [Polyangiaceae bacterium]|nr:hypothetical protein [Polyangiaceae bacterium]
MDRGVSHTADHRRLTPLRLRGFGLRGFGLRGFLLVAVLTRGTAWAASSGWLEVERDEEAQSCPEVDALRSSVERLLETPPSAGTPLIHVTFHKEGALLSARLTRIGDEAAARELRDSHSDCETLTQAVSTTVALMLETRVTLPEPAPVGFAEAPKIVPAPDVVHNYAWFEVSGGAALGVVNGVSPELSASGVFRHDAFDFSVGALWILPKRISLGPGHVDAHIVALTSRGCWAPLNQREATLRGCTGFFAGIFQAQARGYTRDLQTSKPWLAVPLELSLGGQITSSDGLWLGWRLGATLLAPLQRQTFSVQGLGRAVDPSRLQGLTWLGLEAYLR